MIDPTTPSDPTNSASAGPDTAAQPAPNPAPAAPAVPPPSAAPPPDEATAADLTARLHTAAATPSPDPADMRRLLEDLTAEVRRLGDQVATLQTSPLVTDHAEAQRLDQVRTGLLATLTGLAGALAVRTVEALYDGWVQANLLPLLPAWVQRPWAGYLQGSRPVSPLPVQPASPVSRPETVKRQPVSERREEVPLPELVRVPAGWFLMGNDKKRDPAAHASERPQHWVWLEEFWIGKYPVTNWQYCAFTSATHYQSPADWATIAQHNRWQHPVVGVTWHDALAYCKWLSGATGWQCSLPSEAEWEKAARGTDGRIWPWGDQKPDTHLCNFDENMGGTTSVDAYPTGASPYGCLDLAGNVWEWTRNLHGLDSHHNKRYDYPYDAIDGRERLDAPEDMLRVLRGGSYNLQANRVRCAARGGQAPHFRDDFIGFRLVASPSTSVV